MEDLLKRKINQLVLILRFTVLLVLVWFAGSVCLLKFYEPPPNSGTPEQQITAMAPVFDASQVVEGIHVATGLKAGEGLQLVIANCTGCHSAKLITQNRATKEGWKSIINWMQATQNLWDLGNNEEPIVTYLTKNYAPEQKGRRQPLQDIEWYELK